MQSTVQSMGHLATRVFLSFPLMQGCSSGLTGEGDQNRVLDNSQFSISVTAVILICNRSINP